jgi:hypothetical protein
MSLPALSITPFETDVSIEARFGGETLRVFVTACSGSVGDSIATSREGGSKLTIRAR